MTDSPATIREAPSLPFLPPAARHAHALWLGRRPYEPVVSWMAELVKKRIAGEIGDTLLLVEHEPVITLGRGAHAENLLVPEHLLAGMGIARIDATRGGDITYHGPGQLVAYPIFDLKPDRCDVRRYVRDLCDVMVRIAARYGVSAGPFSDKIGAWVDLDSPGRFDADRCARPAKLGAIGVRISRWVTSHGFALNVATDLTQFEMIVPCGIVEFAVTSLDRLVPAAPSLDQIAEAAHVSFSAVFGAEMGPLRDFSHATDLPAIDLDALAHSTR